MNDAPYRQTYLARALADGHANIAGEGRNERIHYIAAGRSERWADPEEKVRAELWAELIYKHEYAPELIDFEVNVPRRTPNDYADLVIYSDDEKKMPYFVIECKRADISDAEFNQAIEQACGNGASLGANYCGAVDGIRRRLLRFDKYPRGERERNHITDFPVRYGNPPPWRFYKNEPGKDLPAVPREELRAAIRKCHQTLWEGGRRSPIAAFGGFSKLAGKRIMMRSNMNQTHLPALLPRGKAIASALVTALFVIVAAAACIMGDEPDAATPTPDLSATIDAALAKVAAERAANVVNDPTRGLAATATPDPMPADTANRESAESGADAVNSPTRGLAATATPDPMPTAISAPTPEGSTPFSTLLNAGYLESKNPHHAKSILGLPWITDGIDVSEREATTQLIQLAAFNERIFQLILHRDEARKLYTLDWIHDTITEPETEALQQLANIAHNDASIAEKVIALPWFADGVTEPEVAALQHLGSITHSDASIADQVIALPWFDDGVTEPEMAGLQQIASMVHDDAAVAGKVIALSWFADGVTEPEVMALQLLGGVAYSNVAVAGKVIALPWFADGVTEPEIAGLRHLGSIAHNDAATAGQIIALPWVGDGVTESEIAALQQFGGIVHNDAAIARQVIALPWVSDAITETEISAIGYIPYHSPAVTKQTIELPWIADGVTVSEIPAIRSITYHDATTVQQIIALTWVADGVSEAERLIIMEIPYHHDDVVNGENHPNQRYIGEKQYMLTLINQERSKAGVPTITMGDNISAQMHAEDMLHNCYLAHKGLDGRQPHERFEDAGGEPSKFGGENIIGRDECLIPHPGSQPSGIPSSDVAGNMIGWMNSPGHRTNLLAISHCKVHIGIAWNGYTSRMVQLFESDGTYSDGPCSTRD